MSDIIVKPKDDDKSALVFESQLGDVDDPPCDASCKHCALAAKREILRQQLQQDGKSKTGSLHVIERVAIHFWLGTDSAWYMSFIAVTLAAVISRLHYIAEPYAVVWDETHFGKMISWYINGTYFSDVHPPGGKLILTFFGWLGGYNGTHSFHNPGVTFEGFKGIIGMRVGCALLGAGTVPLAFITVWVVSRKLPSAILASVLVIVDIGAITLSKFILLDAPLLFFAMASISGVCIHHCYNEKNGSFSKSWWLSLFFTGFMLGWVVSVKFVGLFTVATVGLYTVHTLWGMIATSSLMNMVKHISARVICLIICPLIVYLALFSIHDVLLYKTFSVLGGEEASLSPEFQMQLQGNLLNGARQSPNVVYGSLISLRNNLLAGPYLHSHQLFYPEKKVPEYFQQVTGYRAKDDNNFFRVLYPMDDPEAGNYFYEDPQETLFSGEFIRLHHPLTNTSLAVSSKPAILTIKHKLVYAENYTVSTPENAGLQVYHDSNIENVKHQIWKVMVVDAEGEEPVEVLKSRLILVNAAHNCALFWPEEKLSKEWAAEQEEITCSRNLKAGGSQWRVEMHVNPFLNSSVQTYNSTYTLWDRFLETHRLMFYTNSKLKPQGEDLDGELVQRPWMWPICYKSQPWYDVNYRIILLGNPIQIWATSALIVCVIIYLFRQGYRRQRNYTDRHPTQDEDKFEFWCKFFLVAYLLHYIPFFTMERVLYYHHYFPALQLASLLSGLYLGHYIQRQSPYHSVLSTVTIIVFSAISFSAYCYVGYGTPTTESYNPDNSTFRNVRLLDSWYI